MSVERLLIVKQQKKSEDKKTEKTLHLGMWLCCTFMLVPLALFFMGGGTIAGLWNNLAVLAPIVLCLGVHGLMFLVFKKSCHGGQKQDMVDQQKRI